MKTLVFYISGHGYGHAVRECFLIEQIPENIEVHIVTSIPKALFEEELQRPFCYRYGRFDLGCVQIDAVTVDIDATLDTYGAIIKENNEKKVEELLFLKSVNASAIVSDIVPFVSTLAKEIGIPSFALSNFSWYETYQQYIVDTSSLILKQLQSEYEQFTYWIRLYPGTTLPLSFKGEKEVLSEVALLRKGRKLKEDICEKYGIDISEKLVLLYIGTYGMDAVEWERLELLDDYHFVGYYELPVSVKNYTLVSKDCFNLQDFSASSDVIISKLGYGIVTESLSSGTPILYMPRENFIEFPALEHDLQKAQNSMCISQSQFNALQIENELRELVTKKVPEKLLKDSNKKIIDWILERV